MNWQGLIILHLHKQKQKQPQAILPTVAHNHAPVTTTHRRFTRHPVAMSPPHKTPDHMPHANKPLPSSPLLSFPGYGILFFHQLGILKYLENQFDLSACSFVGSSAGSSLSVFAANGVDPQSALDLAHALCIKHGVFQRPLGLMGVWGGIVREWLDILLPDDAADRCVCAQGSFAWCAAIVLLPEPASPIPLRHLHRRFPQTRSSNHIHTPMCHICCFLHCGVMPCHFHPTGAMAACK